jgi:TrpR-related protein YerC/YecD
MIEKIKSEQIDYLFKAMMSLESIEEFYKFFDDLCTVSEISEMSKRFQAAMMLKAGTIYNEISEITVLSTNTITRVNRCLKYGSDGYNIALDRLQNKDNKANEK